MKKPVPLPPEPAGATYSLKDVRGTQTKVVQRSDGKYLKAILDDVLLGSKLEWSPFYNDALAFDGPDNLLELVAILGNEVTLD